jgi:hypothetical protein
LAVLDPNATFTDEGTVNAVLLLVSTTVTPPAAAACESVTVHVAVCPEPRLAGLQDTLLTAACVASKMDAVCVLPP